MTITYYKELAQGSAEWLKARCGKLTASEFDAIVTTANLKFSESKGCRTHMYNLLAQRITKYVEPVFESYDMMRGHADEIEARDIYSRTYAPVEQCGFIENDSYGFSLGYSPDGLVGDDGLIEIKSRAPKYQMQTIIEDEIPAEYMVQVQVGLLISERKWCDFVSYCGGLPMYTKRVLPDLGIQANLIAAATEFEKRMDDLTIEFAKRLDRKEMRLVQTQRKQYDTGGAL